MPSKREVLQQLKRDELQSAVDHFELSVRDRRLRDELVDALGSSRKAALSEILDTLPRTRLKEICRHLGLDDSGREKALLVARLTGQQAVASAPEPPAAPAAPRRRQASAAPTPAVVAPGGKLTREALERHLWSAADILRGSIDSSDYKNYILGLLFLKRLSDRFEEECEIVRAEGLDPEDPDEHQFFVPPEARWSRLGKVSTSIGEALNIATTKLEEQNPKLEGVLAGIDFNDERKLGDTRQRDQVLGNLVLHFSKIDLRNENLSEPDMLGRAYEYLIERFADDAGKKGGEFYTPHQVVRLMVEILRPQEGMRICDPTCGSGGMLIQCAQYVQRNGGDPRNLSLYGQEKNLGTWAICKMNMLLHGFLDHDIRKGDTIREPKLVEDGALMTFDLVIANPPFSLDNWGREVVENDPWRRFRFGIPPKSKGDLAFVQHMVAVLNATGRMAVVMPHGVLFRGGSEGEIRKELIEEDLLETVIGLAPNLFYGTGIPAAILILNRDKEPERRSRIRLIDASKEAEEGLNQKALTGSNIRVILEHIQRAEDVPGFCRSVDLDEIAANEFNLNLTRYFDQSQEANELDIAIAIKDLRVAEEQRAAAAARLNRYLHEFGYES